MKTFNEMASSYLFWTELRCFRIQCLEECWHDLIKQWTNNQDLNPQPLYKSTKNSLPFCWAKITPFRVKRRTSEVGHKFRVLSEPGNHGSSHPIKTQSIISFGHTDCTLQCAWPTEQAANCGISFPETVLHHAAVYTNPAADFTTLHIDSDKPFR